MPSRLKSFELHGYKTFAARTEFIFANGVTAIVGPNGSGKSNIADALRWVLGEQSFGLLRAKKTEDMIFAGSEHRPRAGMASATIVFDNSDGWLPIDFSEVGITRRAYRDGDNEYLLNGQRVRLRDVSELLAQSGLAERTYTVIGQGLVDAALSLKAEERRRLFEEAAGIGLHRARRDEALRRLDTTSRNLERVQDILAELQPRLRSLERQARRAQDYEQARVDLKILLRDWYGYHWHQAQAELTDARNISLKQEQELGKVRQEQSGLDRNLTVLRGKSLELNNRLREWNLKLSGVYSQRERLTREQAVVEERVRSLTMQENLAEAEILRMNDEKNYIQEQINHVSGEIEHLTKEKDEAEINLSDTIQSLEIGQKRVDVAKNEVEEAQQDLSALNTQQSILRMQLEERHISIGRLQKQLDETMVALGKTEQELTEHKESLIAAVSRQKELEHEFHEAEVALQVKQQEITRLETLRRKKLVEQDKAQSKLSQLQMQHVLLRQAEESLSGYADGARLLLQALRDSRITGAQGALSNFLHVPDDYEKAIASVLGEFLGAVLVDGWDGVEDALKILDDGSARGVLVDLEALMPIKPLKLDISKAPVEKDAIIGIASEVVEVKGKTRQVIDLLLGQVVIVKDRSTARSLLSKRNWSAVPLLRIVTLKGEIFYSNGSVFSASNEQGILSRPRQRQEIDVAISEAKQVLSDTVAAVEESEKALSLASENEKDARRNYQRSQEVQRLSATEVGQLELTVEKAKRMMNWQGEQLENIKAEIQELGKNVSQIETNLASLEGEIRESRLKLHDKTVFLETLAVDELQGKVSYWQTQAAVIAKAVEAAENSKNERLVTWTKTNKLLQMTQDRKKEMESEIDSLGKRRNEISDQFSTINKEIEDLRALILPVEAELIKVEETLRQWIATDVKARQTLSTAEHQYAQARILLSRRQESLDSLRHRIEDDFGLVAFEYDETVSGPKPLPLDGMVEELPKILQIAPDLEENVQRQRALLRRMGPVNPEAQSEYQQVKERFEFLTSQIVDLHKAESDIKEVIAELDLLMEREFRKTFDAVAQEFRQIFTRLFGGGAARLILTDPDDMTETGIDIEARLPGRREQGLSLLSGGERSLTATALVFALLRISPTPFCIFDEVDAMLDEANVSRFRDLLTELSEHTQFIIITHNRNTVQAASVIYGVTMGRDSASQVISLKLDELTEEYGVQKG